MSNLLTLIKCPNSKMDPINNNWSSRYGNILLERDTIRKIGDDEFGINVDLYYNIIL